MTDGGLRSNSSRALVVDDEASVRDLLRLHLGREGFDVHDSAGGQEALARIEHEAFDLLVLDLLLPELDGVTLCRAARTRGPNVQTPIVMLTARDSEADRVIGLESGADDYVTKPFGVRELLARVRAVLRRGPGAMPVAHAPPGGLRVDPVRREATARGERLELTRQEFDLLALLVAHPGIVFSRAALLARIWGRDRDVTLRTVDAAISRLRKKVERDPDAPALIRTAWGAGYHFTDAAG